MEALIEIVHQKKFKLKDVYRVLYNTDLFSRESTRESIAFSMNMGFPGPVSRRVSAEQMWDNLMVLRNDLVGQFHNEIRAEVTALWRSADPVALQDPRMDVVTNRVETLLRNRFEGEASPEHPRIRKVVIVCGTGFRVRG